MSKDDKYVLDTLTRTVRIVDGHYEVGILWKSEDPWLPENELVNEEMLCSLKRKLKKYKELYKKERSFIDQHLNKEYARQLTTDEADKRSN